MKTYEVTETWIRTMRVAAPDKRTAIRAAQYEGDHVLGDEGFTGDTEAREVDGEATWTVDENGELVDLMYAPRPVDSTGAPYLGGLKAVPRETIELLRACAVDDRAVWTDGTCMLIGERTADLPEHKDSVAKMARAALAPADDNAFTTDRAPLIEWIIAQDTFAVRIAGMPVQPKVVLPMLARLDGDRVTVSKMRDMDGVGPLRFAGASRVALVMPVREESAQNPPVWGGA